jgi:Tol biopolymer transport system component
MRHESPRLSPWLLLPLVCAPVSAQTTVQASVSASGLRGNGPSDTPSLSADGRCVLFSSAATNLAAGDPDATDDAFVRDLWNGTTEMVSVDSNGVHADGRSRANSISADGRFVTFESVAGNLMANDGNGDSDIFVRDRLLGTTTPVSLSSAGAQGNGNSVVSVLSLDGRWVAFRSRANNLVAGDTNGEWDIFLRDLWNGTTERVNLGPSGAQAHGDSYTTSVSADGRFVLFSSLASDLVPGDVNNERDVFVRDRLAGTTSLVSSSSAGLQSDGDSHAGYLSADGRFATFVSEATNLVAGDTNGVQDVFVRELASGVTTRVSVRSDGAQADGWSTGSGITPDGRFVAITSDATNLVPGDLGFRDVFLHDRWTGTIARVGLGQGGAAPDSDCYSWGGALSADARHVSFFSAAGNLVPTNPGGQFDVYVHDRGAASSFVALCEGDAACPCGNAGSSGHGCENSGATGGALLVAAGQASLSADTLQLAASGELPSALSILLQGNTLLGPVAFGDGLRCAGGQLRRLYSANASGGALTLPPAGGPSLSARSAALGDPLAIGSVRVYQTYYRDPAAAFCPAPQGATFNATQAIAVAWGA